MLVPSENLVIHSSRDLMFHKLDPYKQKETYYL